MRPDRVPSYVDVDPVTVHIQPGSVPKYHGSRIVPLAYKDAVTKELYKLLKEGIIYPVHVSLWASAIVVVRKPDGGLRLCADYKPTVNPNIFHDKYTLPLIDDLISQASGGCVFSKLDLRKAYYQVLLDPESQKLTTINTTHGLFRYRSLPFGFTNAPSIFQKLMDGIFGSLQREGVIVYQDDILVASPDIQSHMKALNSVLSLMKQYNLQLNLAKCVFCATDVIFLGHELSAGA